MSLLLSWLTGGSGSRPCSERAILEVPGRRHFRQWAAVRAASRDHLVAFEPRWADDELTRAGWRRRLKRYREDRRSGAGYAYLVMRRADGALVGGVSLANVRRGVTQSASVGYWTGLPFAGQGYAGEALAAVLDLAFGALDLHRVEAACMPSNAASVRVLERAGFRREGLARGYLKINGRWEDHLLFARLRHDTVGSVPGASVPAGAPEADAAVPRDEAGRPIEAAAEHRHPVRGWAA